MQLKKGEFQARLNAAVALLSAGCWSWEVRQKLRETFGMSKPTAWRYVMLAQKCIFKDLSLSEEQLRNNSIAFYRSVVADPSQETKDRLKAQERIDKLLGLEAPRVLRVSGTHVITAKTEIAIKLVDVARENNEVRDALLGLSRSLSLQ